MSLRIRQSDKRGIGVCIFQSSRHDGDGQPGFLRKRQTVAQARVIGLHAQYPRDKRLIRPVAPVCLGKTAVQTDVRRHGRSTQKRPCDEPNTRRARGM